MKIATGILYQISEKSAHWMLMSSHTMKISYMPIVHHAKLNLSESTILKTIGLEASECQDSSPKQKSRFTV